MRLTYFCQLVERLSSCAILDYFYSNRKLHCVPFRNPDTLWSNISDYHFFKCTHNETNATNSKRQLLVPYVLIRTLLGPAAWVYGALLASGSACGLELLSLQDPGGQNSLGKKNQQFFKKKKKTNLNITVNPSESNWPLCFEGISSWLACGGWPGLGGTAQSARTQRRKWREGQ